MKAVELFAGAGGAALGLQAAGVEHLRCIEKDEDAAATLAGAGFPAIRGDVRELGHYDLLSPDLVWSSFPCQCWSKGGKRKGAQDERNGFPWTVDALEVLRPRWCILENVPGLTTHREGCDPVCLGPELCPAAYLDHVIFPELLRFFECVDMRLLNASSYGVPQRRHRLFVVAGPSRITWPEPTHGKPTDQIDLWGQRLLPWVTAGEALGLNGARLIGGGRNDSDPNRSPRTYRDLTDEPCTTIAAAQIGNAGPWVVPSDEVDAVGAITPDSLGSTSKRTISVEECSIIQGFPKDYPWVGGKGSRRAQIGNAVPPALASAVAGSVLEADSRVGCVA